MSTDVDGMIEVLSFAPYTGESTNTAAWTDQMRRQLAEYLVKHVVRTDELAGNQGDLPALREAIEKQVKFQEKE